MRLMVLWMTGETLHNLETYIVNKATQATPGVLPPGNGDDARYVTLTGAVTLDVPEWERIGRPTWCVRWISCVELPGGESRPEYLYARTRIPAYDRLVVAGIPPFETTGVEYGFVTPKREEWYAPAVVQSASLGAARSLVRDTRAAGGDYITWDRSLSRQTVQMYQLDGADPWECGTLPVYPDTARPQAAGAHVPGPGHVLMPEAARNANDTRPRHYKRKVK